MKTIASPEGSAIQLKQKGSKTFVEANFGYNPGVDKLARIEDTGNGYICKFYSHLSTRQDNYICLDYDEAEYLLHALQFIKEKE